MQLESTSHYIGKSNGVSTFFIFSLMTVPIGLPFGDGASDECLDGNENDCGMITMEGVVVEEKELKTTYTFFDQPFHSVFVSFSKYYFDFDIKAATIQVCENGLISFEDSDDFCDYPTDLKNSTAYLIVGFFGEDIQLHRNRGTPSAFYQERSKHDKNGCFLESKKKVMEHLQIKELEFNATHIFVSTWHGIESGGGGTVSVLLHSLFVQ